jgi:hypothetical protein
MRARDQRQHRNLSAQYLKLGKMSRQKLPEQVRKPSPSSQDSGATRVTISGSSNLTKEIHRMQARAKGSQKPVTRTRGSGERITDDRVR